MSEDQFIKRDEAQRHDGGQDHHIVAVRGQVEMIGCYYSKGKQKEVNDGKEQRGPDDIHRRASEASLAQSVCLLIMTQQHDDRKHHDPRMQEQRVRERQPGDEPPQDLRQREADVLQGQHRPKIRGPKSVPLTGRL